MSKENLKNFLEFLKENKNEGMAAQEIGSNHELFVAFGREKGFNFDVQDIKALAQELMQFSQELTDTELEEASGGNIEVTIMPIYPQLISIIKI